MLRCQLADENRRLRLMIEQREATNASLKQHIDSLAERLQHPAATGSHDDLVSLLEEQARQFREDFESEKRDRLAAEAEVQALRQQLAAANSQVQLLLTYLFTYLLTSCFHSAKHKRPVNNCKKCLDSFFAISTVWMLLSYCICGNILYVLCFDAVVGWQEGHPACKN